jgi:hypothetical protein
LLRNEIRAADRINRPDGNVTGVNMLLYRQTTKQLGLVPNSKAID